jgi:cell division protease FtsH
MKATDIAKSMVKEYGMSERLGHMTFERERRSMFLDVAPNFSTKDYSEETAREIDNEVRRIIEDAYTKVKTVLSDKRDLLDTVAKTLLVKEVLEGDELRQLIGEHAEQNGIDELRKKTN